MLFCNYRNVADFCIKIEDNIVQFVNETKFLGVLLDNRLSWESHINNVVGKMAKLAGLFNKLKFKINQKTFMTLYNTFVYPYLTYCDIVSGSTAKIHLNKITVVQKRILRIMCNAKFRDHTAVLYKNTSILEVSQLYIFNVCLFMYKYSHNLLPKIFDTMFQITHDLHEYSTRNSCLLVLPLCRTEMRKQFVVYNGAYYYNKLINLSCINLYAIHSLSMFKRNVKKVIFENLLY